MIQTSDAYKSMMDKPIRKRGYVSVSLGVVNQNAQGNASVNSNTSRKYYSKGNLFDNAENGTTYGTLEQNFAKADGTFKFVPREAPNIALQNNGIVVPVGESLTINFDTAYSIKGFTIDFVETSYPTDFTIVTDEETVTITGNDTHNFTTESVLGHTTSITITPTAMSGGVQCMHIKRIVMGVGLTFSDSNVESAELDSFISGISIETSYKDLTVSAFDEKGQFDVDNESAFINYLQSGQPVNISFGVDLDDGTQEWHQVASCRLRDWSAKKGRVSFNATDLLSRTESTYSHMVLTSRTAKSEFEAIFADMGLTANDYVIDNYFASVNITNPIEENTHRDCLQLLANATRGIVYEDENGIVHVEKNFDKIVTFDETRYSVGYGVAKTDQYGNPYLYSYWKTLDDGTFRKISTKNLLDPAENSGNIIEIETSQCRTEPLLPIEFIDNFMCQGENAESGQQAIIAISIKCSHTAKNFPIKESGWYCAGYRKFSQYYRNSNTAYAKLGNRTLQIESNSDQFNFYVSPEDLGAGDLELFFTGMKSYKASGFKDGFFVRKGKLNSSGYMEGYEEDEYAYEDYYVERYPHMLLEWSGAGVTVSNASLLFTLKNPKPTRIRFVRHILAGGTATEEFDVTGDFLEYPIPYKTSYVYAYMMSAQPNQTAVLYKPIVKEIGKYCLSFDSMLESPYATMDEKIKAVRVKIFTYQNNGGDIEQVDDDVYYTETLDTSGVVKTVENPLISTSAQAELVAKWAKAYYAKNLTYNYEYRGEPALQANDVMYAESEASIVNTLDAERVKLSFNGAFSGQIEARKTLTVES